MDPSSLVSRRKTGSGTLGLAVSLAIFSLGVAALAAELVAVERTAVVEEFDNMEAVADLGRRISLVAELVRIAIVEELAPFGLVVTDRQVVERIVSLVELVAVPHISSVEGQTERFAVVELVVEIF